MSEDRGSRTSSNLTADEDTHIHTCMCHREAVFEDRGLRTSGDLTADEAELRGLEHRGGSKGGRTQKPGHIPKSSMMSMAGASQVSCVWVCVWACVWACLSCVWACVWACV